MTESEKAGALSVPLADVFPFTYAQIDCALAKLYNFDEKTVGALRGRINNFNRLKIVPSSPGRGRRIVYTYGDALTWTLCLELAEYGIPPEVIKLIVLTHRDAISSALVASKANFWLKMAEQPPGNFDDMTRKVRSSRPHLFLWLAPRLLNNPRDVETIKRSSGLESLSKEAVGSLLTDKRLSSALFIDLTRLRGRLFSALLRTVSAQISASKK
jgi:hypothetical protein